MRFSLWFSPQHTLDTSGYHRAGKWVCSEPKAQPPHSPLTESAKSAFAPSLWKGEEVLEAPGASGINPAPLTMRKKQEKSIVNFPYLHAWNSRALPVLWFDLEPSPDVVSDRSRNLNEKWNMFRSSDTRGKKPDKMIACQRRQRTRCRCFSLLPMSGMKML